MKNNSKKYLIAILLIFLFLTTYLYFNEYVENLRLNSDIEATSNHIDSIKQELEIFQIKSNIDDQYIASRSDSILVKYAILDSTGKFPKIYETRRLQDSFYIKTISSKKSDVIRLQNQINQLEQEKSELDESSEEYLSEIKKISSSIDSLIKLNNKNYEKINELITSNYTLKSQNNNLKEVLKFEKDNNTIYYIGEKIEGKANGYGFGFWSSGGMYEGYWLDNTRHGKGTYRWADGEIYIGEFVKGSRTGEGTYYWKDGEYYTGEWKDNRRHGIGAIYNKNGKLRYKGEWKDDSLIKEYN